MGFYGPHVDQSESRILQSHIIKLYINTENVLYLIVK
jgi:hypothetical protein